MADETLLGQARVSLEGVQNFDARSLERRDELGVTFAFVEAVEPAEKIISFFKLLPSDILHVFPDSQLSQIKQSADAVYSLYQSILGFDPAQADATEKKTTTYKSTNFKLPNLVFCDVPVCLFFCCEDG